MNLLQYILENANNNGTYPSLTYKGFSQAADLVASGTFGGASIQLQMNIASEKNDVLLPEWVNIGEPITNLQARRIDMTRNTMLRAIVTGASGTTNLVLVIHHQ